MGVDVQLLKAKKKMTRTFIGYFVCIVSMFHSVRKYLNSNSRLFRFCSA